jgi:hypothetical protein
MTDSATLEARLEEAEAALHRLLTGAQVVELRHAAGPASRTGIFTRAEVGPLRAYIADLRRQLGLTTGRRAIGVRF